MKPITQEMATLARCAISFWKQAESDSDRQDIMDGFLRAADRLGYKPSDLEPMISGALSDV
jgi:hypothetical protein